MRCTKYQKNDFSRVYSIYSCSGIRSIDHTLSLVLVKTLFNWYFNLAFNQVEWLQLDFFFTDSVFPNITNNTTEPGSKNSAFFIPPNIQIGVTILAVSIFILALIGNIVVIYIVCTVNHMRSSTNTLIANMAVADLLMTIDIPYILKFFYVDDKWFGTFMGTVLCKFFHSAQVGSLIASVFSLVAISLDRSFAILFPMKTVMTKHVVRFAIAVVWLGALAFSLPVMVASKTAQLEGTDFLSCAEVWAPMSASTYSLVLIIGGYIIPLIIIAVVYSLAGIRLWSRQLPGHKNLVSNKKAQSSSRRATAMLITVVIVFALSWLPFQTLEMLRGFNKPLFYSLPIELRYTTPWFGYANSAINPILYVIFSENYRQEFYRILCRGPTRKDRYRRTIISRSTTTRSTRLSRASSMAVSIPLQKLREEANYRRLGPESPWYRAAISWRQDMITWFNSLPQDPSFVTSWPRYKRHQSFQEAVTQAVTK